VNCTHCGTLLPRGALFCGECGRSVGSTAGTAPRNAGVRAAAVSSPRDATVIAPPRWVEDPVTGEAIDDEPKDDFGDIVLGGGDSHCEQCGTAMEADDIFCGECGFVSRSVTRAFSTTAFTGETSVLDLSPLPDLASEPEPEPEPEAGPAPEPAVGSEPSLESRPQFGAVPASEPEPVVEPEPAQRLSVRPPPPVRPEAPPTPPAPSNRPQQVSPAEADDDLEATRIVSRISGNRFVLQFSTGESFTVHGTGLIGRNPQPEPGEYFDHLIRVLDSGRSVSKTHLEFGQEEGAFWIKDRFSGNGTVIREPEISARRADSDRRYRLVRGTRVDIGEQFFVIS
jgi:predicted nucleic acid-binding Zn ribbon protein/pSer/pThr/pTyr-binding forkhead associated (FHA) protein